METRMKKERTQLRRKSSFKFRTRWRELEVKEHFPVELLCMGCGELTENILEPWMVSEEYLRGFVLCLLWLIWFYSWWWWLQFDLLAERRSQELAAQFLSLEDFGGVIVVPHIFCSCSQHCTITSQNITEHLRGLSWHSYFQRSLLRVQGEMVKNPAKPKTS